MRARNPAPWLALLWGPALVMAALLAVWAPPGQPYDEPAHHSNVVFYARELRLPVLGEPGVHYEAQMGPVYYVLAALLLRLTGTAELPEAGLAVLRSAGLVLVPLLGWLTYRLARTLGARELPSVVASGLVVLNPTLLAVAASAQNDYLCLVVTAAAALVALRALRGEADGTPFVVGALVGLAVLTKVFAGALLVGFVVAVLLDGRRGVRARTVDASLAVLGTAVVSGWWFVRNLVLYGDLTGSGAVDRTGVSFDPLEYAGIGSVVGWGRSLVSYAFAPTEYYRNAFDAPTVVKAAAVLLAAALLLFAAWALASKAKGGRRVVEDPRVVFAISSVLVVVGVYMIAAWSVQAIAPRLVAVAAPLALALLARAARSRPRLVVLATVLMGCVLLDGWLLSEVAAIPTDPDLFPW
ncbi:glycosyltransferase family 39 protein [Janibacter sp. YB324]|uniref:glycosyltransferase family 39 protein n=1 Tax=Janibacter sp. YB324 TaxID=2761047 RepID=UPI00162985BB|nr:glycosyltransferase family 39 protein [Janibacter sp. YB324]QNF93450.1 glycosyltransferase family 39 protein [Janibacter sp. YB324]